MAAFDDHNLDDANGWQQTPEGWASTDRAGPGCDDCGGTAFTIELWNSRPLAAPKSAPVTETTHNSGEGDPSVMPDSIGADTVLLAKYQEGNENA